MLNCFRQAFYGELYPHLLRLTADGAGEPLLADDLLAAEAAAADDDDNDPAGPRLARPPRRMLRLVAPPGTVGPLLRSPD